MQLREFFPRSRTDYVAATQALLDADRFDDYAALVDDLLSDDSDQDMTFEDLYAELVMQRMGCALVCAAIESGESGIDKTDRELRFMLEHAVNDATGLEERAGAAQDALDHYNAAREPLIEALRLYVAETKPLDELPQSPWLDPRSTSTPQAQIVYYGLVVDSDEVEAMGFLAELPFYSALFTGIQEAPALGLPLLKHAAQKQALTASQTGWLKGLAESGKKVAGLNPGKLSEAETRLINALSLDNLQLSVFEASYADMFSDDLAAALKTLLNAPEAAAIHAAIPVNAARLLAAMGEPAGFQWVAKALESAPVPSLRFEQLLSALEDALNAFPEEFEDLFEKTTSSTVLFATVMAFPDDIDDDLARAVLKRSAKWKWDAARVETLKVLGYYAPETVLEFIDREVQDSRIPDAWLDAVAEARQFIEDVEAEDSEAN
jgi:hypothetical protein